MSMIDQLSILGIRSFGNESAEVIKFRGPLTLIVGCNGSGKTTIIESLKYATTGQQPPNSVGGAFVHDPELCGEKEVLAQVKLGFRTATGAVFVVNRSMQLTIMKTGARKYKSLESSLMMIKDGERTSMSHRVGELDKIIPQYLGVSEAVLDSVIFCHQDESLWPMSQPLALKKKFDDIFEASKWTKAVDTLKKLRKGQRERLALFREREGHLKKNKETGERIARDARKLSDEIEAIRVQRDALEQEMNAALEVKNDKERRREQASGIVNQLATRNSQSEFLRKEISRLKTTIDELQEPNEWLSSTLAQYEEKMEEHREQAAAFKSQYTSLQSDFSAAQEELSEKQAERGQYQAQKEAYEKKLDERAQLVKQEAHRHEIRGYDGDLDERRIQEFISKLLKMSQEKERELERVRRETEEELRQTRAALNELGSSRAVAHQEKLNASQAIPKNNRKMQDIQREIDTMNMDEGGMAAIEASLKDVQSRLKSAEDKFTAKAYDDILKRDKASLRNFEDEDKRLRSELTEVNKFATDRAQLDIKKQDIKRTQSSLDTLIATHGARLNSVIGNDWQMDSLERDFQHVQDRQSRALDDAKKLQSGAASALSQVEFQLETIRGTLKKKKQDKKTNEIAVLNSILTDDDNPLSSIDEYEKELTLLETECNQIQKDIDGFTYYNDFYSSCLKTANSQDKCKLCERKFNDAKEKSSAIAKITKKLADNAITDLMKDLEVFQADFKKALAARPRYESLKNLSSEITTLEKSFEDLEARRDEAVRVLSRQDVAVGVEVSAKRDLDALKSTVSAIARDTSTISEREAEVLRIASQQKFSGNLSSVDDLNEQSDACNLRIQALRAKMEKTTTEKERAKNLLNSFENESAALTGKLSNAQHELNIKQAKLAAIEEIRENNKELRKTIERIDANLDTLSPKLKNANAKNDEAQQRGRANEKDVQAAKEGLANTMNKFALNEADINSYVENGGPQKLAACQRAIKALTQNQDHLKVELSMAVQKANEEKKLIDDSDRYKRNISENIRYREMLREFETLRVEIVDLEQRQDTDDHERLGREAQVAGQHYQHLFAQYERIIGSASSKDAELLKKNEEWETSYKTAAEEYRKTHIEVETTVAAIDDLAKYENALDNGIMKFHSLKMDQINRIAGELWQNTYQGTDVDTIMIKSDNESGSNNILRRQYNYRVVMVKSNTEMDMRGRCSAGQKVLASIIIRLALAECFGANCGIIALDEPTTNLDRDTIRSLAESLHMIIKHRKGQSNFQLIVITHDEEFLKQMKCQDFADTFFRISRNEKQKSVIEQSPIHGLMGD